MKISEQIIDSVLILSPDGRLDNNTSTDMEKSLGNQIEVGQLHIIVDFQDLIYISSAGLRILLMIAKKIKNLDGRIVLCNLSENIKDVFSVSGFDQIFSIGKSLEDAQKFFK